MSTGAQRHAAGSGSLLVFFFWSLCQFSGCSCILEGGGCEDEMTGSCVLNEPRTRSSVDVLRGYSCKSTTVEVFVQREELTGLQETSESGGFCRGGGAVWPPVL